MLRGLLSEGWLGYVATGSVVVGFILGMTGLANVPSIAVNWGSHGKWDGEYEPELRHHYGQELLFVYIGASTCEWSSTPRTREVVRHLKGSAVDLASQKGLGFAAIGIAKDLVVENGLSHLRKFGKFDEVMTGRGWLNTGVLKYVFGDIPGAAATPQVVLVQRSTAREGGQRQVTEERLLARAVGLKELESWVTNGIPARRLMVGELISGKPLVGNVARERKAHSRSTLGACSWIRNLGIRTQPRQAG